MVTEENEKAKLVQLHGPFPIPGLSQQVDEKAIAAFPVKMAEGAHLALRKVLEMIDRLDGLGGLEFHMQVTH
jgi:hypothetical protein